MAADFFGDIMPNRMKAGVRSIRAVDAPTGKHINTWRKPGILAALA
jgi:hypothetical protein